jgi:GT2 family glycosyltransferase
MIESRTRLVAIAGSLILLLLIVDLVRRRRLKEEYSVLWILTALGLLLLASWYELLQEVTKAIGGVAPSSTLFFFALLFVFFMLLHFSLRVSGLERRLTALVQEMGLLSAGPPAAKAAPADPRVAVVIPCFNDGALAEEAVASVQEDEPVEITVVDDGSTDPDTFERLRALEQRGVRVVRRPNGGPGAARTSGVEATRAGFVVSLDADDRLEPGVLAAMADMLEHRPGAAFVWGDYVLFGDQTGRYRSPERWLPWTLTYVNPYPVCSMFRRSTLERAGGWQTRSYEDWDLWLRFVGLGLEGVRIDRVVYQRRLHGDSRRLAALRREHQRLYDEIQHRNQAVFARRAELRARESPAAWKLAVYPVLFGARTVVPFGVEAFLQRWMMRLGTGLPG